MSFCYDLISLLFSILYSVSKVLIQMTVINQQLKLLFKHLFTFLTISETLHGRKLIKSQRFIGLWKPHQFKLFISFCSSLLLRREDINCLWLFWLLGGIIVNRLLNLSCFCHNFLLKVAEPLFFELYGHLNLATSQRTKAKINIWIMENMIWKRLFIQLLLCLLLSISSDKYSRWLDKIKDYYLTFIYFPWLFSSFGSFWTLET